MDCVEQPTCKKAETPHLHEAIHDAWGKPKPKSDDVNSQAEQSAEAIFSALPKGNCAKGLSPLKANVIWDTLYGKSADEIAAIDKAFTAKYGRLDPKTG